MPRRPLEPRSLEREVYSALLEDIVTGALSAGQPLVEAQLAAELGVSKTPVREALIRLQRDGLVEITPYRGARVTLPSERDVREACELRLWLETQIVRKIGSDVSDELLANIRASIDAAQAAFNAGDSAAYVTSVSTFSDLLVAASDNRYAQEVLANLRNLLGLIANTSRVEPGRKRRSIDEHRAIYEALAAGDVKRAERETRAHLKGIEEDSLRALRGLAATDAAEADAG